jgi:hypothetical protein
VRFVRRQVQPVAQCPHRCTQRPCARAATPARAPTRRAPCAGQAGWSEWG